MELSEKAKSVYDTWQGTTITVDKHGWKIEGNVNETFDTLEELNKYLENIADKLALNGTH